MDNNFYSGLLPLIGAMVFMMFFLCRGFLLIHMNVDKTLLSKLLWWLLVFSISWICLFWLFYTLIFVAELGEAVKTAEKGQRILTEFDNIKGLSFNIDAPRSTYEQLFILSAFSFLGLNSSVSLSGSYQIVIILERLLGIIFPIVLLTVLYQSHTKQRQEGQKTLFVYLNRGWQILNVKKSNTKGIQEIELVSPDSKRETKLLFVSINPDVKEAIINFNFNWKNADLTMVPLFMGKISDALRGDDDELAYQALEYSFYRKNIKDESNEELYFFLEKVKYNHSILRSEILLTDINSVLKIIANENPELADSNSLDKQADEVFDNEQ